MPRESSIRPVKIYFGRTDRHPEEQWLMEAIDLEIQQTRVFAMRDMRRADNATIHPVI